MPNDATLIVRRALDTAWKELAINARELTVAKRDLLVARALSRIRSGTDEPSNEAHNAGGVAGLLSPPTV